MKNHTLGEVSDIYCYIWQWLTNEMLDTTNQHREMPSRVKNVIPPRLQNIFITRDFNSKEKIMFQTESREPPVPLPQSLSLLSPPIMSIGGGPGSYFAETLLEETEPSEREPNLLWSLSWTFPKQSDKEFPLSLIVLVTLPSTEFSAADSPDSSLSAPSPRGLSTWPDSDISSVEIGTGLKILSAADMILSGLRRVLMQGITPLERGRSG